MALPVMTALTWAMELQMLVTFRDGVHAFFISIHFFLLLQRTLMSVGLSVTALAWAMAPRMPSILVWPSYEQASTGIDCVGVTVPVTKRQED
jgi:hypothetical protein